MGKYTDTLEAPYWRFRPTWFYGNIYPNGTYTADIMGCNWTCEHCWSKYGWRTVKPRLELTSVEAAEKLIKGMQRNAQPMARISGGEPSMYWDHTVALIDELLDRTKGKRMRVKGITQVRGEPMGIVIETNGAALTPEQFSAIEDKWGEDAKRVCISLGMKSTTPEGLSDLTGLPPKVAERAHERQLENLMHIVANCKYLVPHAAFIDKYTDPGMFSALQREIERRRPGLGRRLLIVPFKKYGNANRFYTPKRFRESRFPDPLPQRDEEVLLEAADREGRLPEEDQQETPSELTGEMNDHVRNLQEFADAVEAQDLPEGRMNDGEEAA